MRTEPERAKLELIPTKIATGTVSSKSNDLPTTTKITVDLISLLFSDLFMLHFNQQQGTIDGGDTQNHSSLEMLSCQL